MYYRISVVKTSTQKNNRNMQRGKPEPPVIPVGTSAPLSSPTQMISMNNLGAYVSLSSPQYSALFQLHFCFKALNVF